MIVYQTILFTKKIEIVSKQLKISQNILNISWCIANANIIIQMFS